MDAVVFAATTAGARARTDCTSTRQKLRLQLFLSLSLSLCLRMCNNPHFNRGPSWPRRNRQFSLDLENPGPFNSEQMFQVSPTAKSRQKSLSRGRGPEVRVSGMVCLHGCGTGCGCGTGGTRWSCSAWGALKCNGTPRCFGVPALERWVRLPKAGAGDGAVVQHCSCLLWGLAVARRGWFSWRKGLTVSPFAGGDRRQGWIAASGLHWGQHRCMAPVGTV